MAIRSVQQCNILFILSDFVVDAFVISTNCCYRNGETPLCFAVMSGHKVIASNLVTSGADWYIPAICNFFVLTFHSSTLGGPHGSALEIAKKMDQREIYYLLSAFANNNKKVGK